MIFMHNQNEIKNIAMDLRAKRGRDKDCGTSYLQELILSAFLARSSWRKTRSATFRGYISRNSRFPPLATALMFSAFTFLLPSFSPINNAGFCVLLWGCIRYKSLVRFKLNFFIIYFHPFFQFGNELVDAKVFINFCTWNKSRTRKTKDNLNGNIHTCRSIISEKLIKSSRHLFSLSS